MKRITLWLNERDLTLFDNVKEEEGLHGNIEVIRHLLEGYRGNTVRSLEIMANQNKRSLFDDDKER